MRLRLLLVALLIPLVLAASWVSIKNPTQMHFGDEDDNFVLGNYVRQGEKVYGDLFAHHQPLAYVLSAAVQEVTQPDSLFLLVKRHKEALIGWSLLWLIFLLLRYGKVVFLFALNFEFVKYLLLGNLFLSESLAVYPLIFLIAQVFQPEKIKNKLLLLGLGASLGVVSFLLLPLWPLCFVAGLLLMWKQKNLKDCAFLIGGFLIIALVMVLFIDIPSYFINAFYINWAYYIPQSAERNESVSLLGFIAPLLTFISNQNGIWINYLRLWSAILIFGIIYLLKVKRFTTAIIVVVILGLSNLRYSEVGNQNYSGFHQLPWVAALIFSGCYLLLTIFKITKSKLLKVVTIGLLLLACVWSVTIQVDNYRQENDSTKSYYINYSELFDLGEAVRIIRQPGDTLLNVPGEKWLIYWQGDVAHASKMINYFDWMTTVPLLRQNVDPLFAQEKTYPTFFYCECDNHYLNSYLQSYTRLNKDGRTTNLYILPERLKSLTNDQKNQLEYYRFSY